MLNSQKLTITNNYNIKLNLWKATDKINSFSLDIHLQRTHIHILIYRSQTASGGVMVSIISPGVVDRGFCPLSGQTFICCFCAEHAPSKSNSEEWWAPRWDNVPERIAISTFGLLQWSTSHVKIQLSLVGLVHKRHQHYLIETDNTYLLFSS